MTKKSKLTQDPDQRPIKVNPYLETQRKHKKWYQSGVMGKQRGKPRYDLAGKKKSKAKGSIFKHYHK